MRITLLTLVACLLFGSFSAETATAADRPNVLFIPVDDLNDWIGCLGGHPQCKTPNIDRLAKRGLLFTRSYCAAPACNPSRAALLTGVRPHTSGVYHNPQPWRVAMPDVVTLPQHFKANGYNVLGTGKIFHGSYEEPSQYKTYFKRPGDPRPTQKVLNDPHSRAGGIVFGELTEHTDEDMGDYKIVTWASQKLKSLPKDEPFFLACGIYRPHMPWQVPQKYYDMYPVDSVELPKTIPDDLDDVPAKGVKVARPQGDHATILKTDNWKYAVQAYLASVTFADVQVGRLLDALDESGHAENTIVILWGDHGWHLGEKEHWRKFALWEEATRSPLMISVPGVTQPESTCGRPVDFLSVYPSLCDLCGLPLPTQLEGHSFKELLSDPAAEWSTPALTTHGRNNHALRTERFRYIRYEDGSEELYDHDADPQEWTNLADEPQYTGLKDELSGYFPTKNAPNAAYDPKKTNKGKQTPKRKLKQPTK